MKTVMLFASDANMSGATLSMVVLAAEMKKDGRYKPIVVINGSGDAEFALKKYGIEYIVFKEYSWAYHIKPVKTFIKMVLNLSKIGKIRKMIRKYNVDIVHLNTIYIYLPAVAALKEHCKIVWHIREFLEEDQGGHILFKNKAYKLMARADKIVAISKSVKGKYDNLIGADNIKVIYNGVDVDKFYAKREIFKSGIIKIFLPGTIQKWKGQEDLLRATRKILDDGFSDLRVYFAGYASEENLIWFNTAVDRLNVGEYVEYIGFSKNIDQLLKKVDMVCVCSRSEAFGRVTVEAMLSNNLVIGANTAGTAEIIKDGKVGFLYKQGDSEDLAKKIEHAIMHKREARTLADDGREYAKDNFSADKNAREIISLYELLTRNEG